jgi:hypothetical protein
VILRPGMFAANTVAWWAPQSRAGDVVRWPYGAVETAPIDERDIAAVAVRALSEASLAGADFVLTGPAALSHARQVEVIGEVLGPLGVPRALAGRIQARDGRHLAAVGRRVAARRVGGGGRASRVRDHDGGGPHRRARTLLPKLGRRACRQLSERGIGDVRCPPLVLRGRSRVLGCAPLSHPGDRLVSSDPGPQLMQDVHSLIGYAVLGAVALWLVVSFGRRSSKTGVVALSDVPGIFAALSSTGKDGSFAVFLFSAAGQVPATVEELSVQFSIEAGKMGIDWVLLEPPNLASQSRVGTFFERKGYPLLRRRMNEVEYLRVEGEQLADLLQELLRIEFRVTPEQKMNLIASGFAWAH